VPIKWTTQTLGDLRATSKHALTGGPFGSNLVSQDYTDAGVPVIRGCNLPSDAPFSFDDLVFVSERKADALRPNNAVPGDVIFTQRGTLGQVGIIPKGSPYSRFIISQSQMKLAVHPDKADARYLYHFFRLPSTVEMIDGLAISSGVPHINLDILRKFQVLTPPVPIQTQIAAILSAYDEMIGNNRRRMVLLETLAEEVYREWFVRLRFPGHKKVRFVKGVPAGWEIRKLGSILELCYGKALKDADRVLGEFHVYGSSGLIGTHNEALVKMPGLIVGRKGNVGTVYLADRGFFPIDTVYFVRSDLPNSFLYFLLRSMNFINNDAAVPGLNRAQAYSNEFFLPPHPLIKDFAKAADAQFELKHILARENEKLAATRDQLLSRLISGKLSVENLDIQFPPGMAEEIKPEPKATVDA
jgi:type I restriction enzyme S subunit